MAKKMSRVPVSERALLARINRKLAHDGVRLRKCPERSQWYRDLGPYYSVDSNNHICGPNGESIVSIGRDLGVLQPYEEVA